MNQKQCGLTFIELLATITVLSIIGIIIWNVFIQGNKYSQTSISKNMLQQEANLVITNLTKIHQTSAQYEIISSSCQISVSITKKDGTTTSQVFDSPTICYSTNFSGIVDPSQDDINLTITLSDKKNSSNHLDVDTVLYRLKDGGV